MRIGALPKLLLRIVAWGAGSVAALILIWFAANRLFDERPDPRRDAFLTSAEAVIPDAENLAVAIAGLDAPAGSDFLKHGAALKGLYDAHAPWPDIQREKQRPDTLKVTADSRQLDCWMDPDWPVWKDCLPFNGAAQALTENREILARYKALYKIDRYASFGEWHQQLIPLTKLAVVEMRQDMSSGNYEAAYRKWRENFRFTRNQLRRQTDWVGKSIALVDFGVSFPIIEDLLVKQPSLARIHFDELEDLLRPQGIEIIDPAGVARAEYLHLERFFNTPYVASPEFDDRLEWLGWKLAQRNRTQNRYLSYSIDLVAVLRQPWSSLADDLAKTIDRHESIGLDLVIDPFGSLLFFRNIYWQNKLTSLLRQVYISDGRLRLATLVVRAAQEQVKDADLLVFLANAAPELYDPFSNKPMLWDPEHGRIYFLSGDDKCSITPFRVPVWDAKSGRQSPKQADWAIC